MNTAQHSNNGNGKASGFFVAPEASGVAGAISYWRMSGNVSLASLTAAWQAQGLDAKLLPEQPSDEVALRRAVFELQGKRRLVRPLGKRGNYAVLDETVTGDGKDVEHVKVCTVTFNDASKSPAIEAGASTWATFTAAASQIQANYESARVSLAPIDVSTWLVKLANDNSSVSLRDSGGIYFLPKPAVDFWRKVVSAVQSVSEHRVFQIPALKNSEAIDAILDAVTTEAQTMVTEIEEELSTPEEERIGHRAFEGRARLCSAMLDKISGYESLLGVKLDAVREQIGNLQASVAAAALAS